MIINLTPEETQNLIVFLNRVQIAGSEATALLVLRQKIEQAIQGELQVAATPQPIETDFPAP